MSARRGAAGLRALHVDGLLATFHDAGILGVADVGVARRLGRLAAAPGTEPGAGDDRVLLAVALTCRAVRAGSVCVDLTQVASSIPDDTGVEDGGVEDGGIEDGGVEETGAEGPGSRGNPSDPSLLPWPEPVSWLRACAASPLVSVDRDVWAPLRLVDGLLYLDRYWQQEQLVRSSLDERARRLPPPVDVAALEASLTRHFPAPPPDRQRLAVALAATRWVTVLAGAPGTGKTTTIARLLAVLREQPGPPPRIALAAPTGKAAARLQEAVQGAGLGLDLTASTLHRLLGWRPGNRSRFRHDHTNHLPYDLVVVDETSMVSLTLMSRLLDAVRPDARLVLVGDPDQLASVEAGAVLGDLVARPPRVETPDPALTALLARDLEPDEQAAAVAARGVVRLSHVHRFGGRIAELAAAVRSGDADAAVGLLRGGGGTGCDDGGVVELVEDGSTVGLRAAVLDAARPLVEAARRGDAAAALAGLDAHRLLCAHRRGPYGVGFWAAQVAAWLAEAGLREPGEWALGRAVIVTSNDHELQLFNGDTGVLVAGRPDEREPTAPVVAFARSGGPLLLAPGRLPIVQPLDALTVHRSQGSQFTAVSVLLPPPTSPLLTRELLYTALSRARVHVRVIGTEEAVRAAVSRPVVRASGLRRRLD